VGLKSTYEKENIHQEWELVYRQSGLQKFNTEMMDRVIQYINPPEQALFLDAGCGTADHSMRVARKGYKCVGVDISETVLGKAKQNIRQYKLDGNVFLFCQDLEDSAFKDDIFDVIHCRGVLMHIPNWEKALANLCRALKPGGKMIIIESNHKSIEAWIVLLVRKIMNRESSLVETDGGLEFWSDKDGDPFVARMANIKHLMHALKKNRIKVKNVFATEFFDINRFPEGILRNIIIKYNYLWFHLGLPSLFCAGNAILGEKELNHERVSE